MPNGWGRPIGLGDPVRQGDRGAGKQLLVRKDREKPERIFRWRQESRGELAKMIPCFEIVRVIHGLVMYHH